VPPRGYSGVLRHPSSIPHGQPTGAASRLEQARAQVATHGCTLSRQKWSHKRPEPRATTWRYFGIVRRNGGRRASHVITTRLSIRPVLGACAQLERRRRRGFTRCEWEARSRRSDRCAPGRAARDRADHSDARNNETGAVQRIEAMRNRARTAGVAAALAWRGKRRAATGRRRMGAGAWT